MTSKLIKTVKEFRDFQKRNSEFEKVKNYALQRNSVEVFGETKEVTIPKEIRSSYWNLFESIANKSSIIHTSPHFDIEREYQIPFFAVAEDGKANLKLRYNLNSIGLEISNYSFHGQDSTEIKEIANFITYNIGTEILPGEETKMQISKTDLKVGENFAYNSGFSANHLISRIFDKIQDQDIIPKIEHWRAYEIKNKKQAWNKTRRKI